MGWLVIGFIILFLWVIDSNTLSRRNDRDTEEKQYSESELERQNAQRRIMRKKFLAQINKASDESVTATGIVSPYQKPTLLREFERWGIKSLWHMTHVDNVSNITGAGLLSHQSSKKSPIKPIDISDADVQQWRQREDPIYGMSIHDYVPLYINPRNPMLYRRKEIQRDICFLEISLEALLGKNYLISDGNAASARTLFFSSYSSLSELPWDVLQSEFWANFDDGKRKRCAEVLLPGGISPDHIKSIHCYSNEVALNLAKDGIRSVISPKKYFE